MSLAIIRELGAKSVECSIKCDDMRNTPVANRKGLHLKKFKSCEVNRLKKSSYCTLPSETFKGEKKSEVVGSSDHLDLELAF